MASLLACGDSRPAPLPLPTVVSLSPIEPVLVPGRMVWSAFSGLSLREGLLVIGPVGSLLLQDDGSTQVHWIGSKSPFAAGVDGRVLVSDSHGDYGYDLKTRTWGPPPAALPVDAPDIELRDGVLRVGTRTLDLHLPEARVVASERGEDGRFRIALGPPDRDWLDVEVVDVFAARELANRLPANTDGLCELVVLTLADTGGRLREVDRWTRPLPAGDGVGGVERAEMVTALATRGGKTWAVWREVLGALGPGDAWAPADLGKVRDLVVHRDQLWAVGDGVWRLDGERWTQVLAPWDVPDSPLDGSVVSLRRLTSQAWGGAGVPALNGLAIRGTNGHRGDPLRHDRFFQLYGDCTDWIGLTAEGIIFEGEPMISQAVPAGEPTTLLARGGVAIVGGSDGVAIRPWPTADRGTDTWVRVPGSEDVGTIEVLDARVTDGKVDLWYADAESLCHAGSGGARCEPLPRVLSIAAAPGGAWAVAQHRLWYMPSDGPPVNRLEDLKLEHGYPQAVLYDAERAVVWLSAATELLALQPETGAALGRWPVDLDPVYALALDPQGLRIFGPFGDHLARFDSER